ncbi:PBP1A family penicillin-binding protein [Pelagibacteraceae bacterium]|jgi:penicillin-binding protein 1A|nr:PBP1A family penicillin-binding protein [Pelagibacteraceae bacterium]MDC0952672.1 PBP1A family penicillin-binding protein [Pelagibacteraceae bacterium]
MLKFANFFVKFSIIFLIVIFVFALSTLWYFSIGLPDYKKLTNYQPPISSRVYSDDGKLIAEYALQKRLFVPYESVPEVIINSFLSAEDKNFFSHPGVDAKGILRAVIKNLKNISQNKRLEGASTITQQVAKNFLLTNEVSFKRKIKEAILAFRIERAYSKERILELYLNQIYLGQGTYGIAAASLEYFDKSIKELTYSDAALLAALPKAPSKYNPYKYPKIGKFRRNLVLQNLEENNFISKKQYNKFKNLELNLKKRKIEIVNEANSYTEEVRRSVNDNYGFEKLYSQGLSIRTPLNIKYQIQAIKSLRKGIEEYDRRNGWRGPIANKIRDKNWQKKLDKFKLDPTLKWEFAEIININNNEINFKILDAKKNNNFGVLNVKNIKWTIPKNKSIPDRYKIGDIIFVKKEKNSWSLKQYPKVNGGIVVLDPYVGDVKALVGGFNFKSSEFNRVTQAKRQPGSAFKPIVYAAALENGFAPNSIILDAPFVESQGVGLKNWKPENYGKKFYGPTTLRKGIEYSRNLMTVRIAKILGLNKILDLSKKLDIYDEIPELLSVSLGAAETSLINLTAAYAPFVNGGKKIKPNLISRIQDRRGKTIFQVKNRKCLGCDKFIDQSVEYPIIENTNKRVLSKETAYQMVTILSGAVERGTAKKLKSLNVPLAGKTGTTNDNYDAWFIGFSSNLVIGVYIGFDNPKTLGRYETGSKAALPVFKNFIENALFKEDFDDFRIPENIYLTSLNYDTGLKSSPGDKRTIVEALKIKDINNIDNNNLISINERDKLIKFRQFY